MDDFIVEFNGNYCNIKLGEYGNGRLAIKLTSDGMPYAVATVNVPQQPLADDEIAVKDWSENEGMVKALKDAGIISGVNRTVPQGFVDIPVCQLTDKFLEVISYG